MEGFKRKTPEEILLSISKLHRGSLKIYIGPVSGSGKTYHMLREGHALRQQGIDVVICAVSTLQRPETVEQLGDLERVPSNHWMKEGVRTKGFELRCLIGEKSGSCSCRWPSPPESPGCPFSNKARGYQISCSLTILV